MTRTEEAIEVLISHGYEEEAEILRQASKLAQEVEPVGFRWRKRGSRDRTWTLCRMEYLPDAEDEAVDWELVYAHPAGDKLRKAAEKVIKYWSEWTWWKECSGELLRDLKKALEDK
jgi:hypothetical protein